MYSTVGAKFISLIGQVIDWLSFNFIGSAYMFMILMVLFAVILTLGGKNE